MDRELIERLRDGYVKACDSWKLDGDEVLSAYYDGKVMALNEVILMLRNEEREKNDGK